MNANQERQERIELRVFREFAKVCPLPFDLATAEKRNKPEPDILCQLRDGEFLAFELVSVEDVVGKDKNGKDIAVTKPYNESFMLYRELQDAYQKALLEGNIQQPEKFNGHTVEVIYTHTSTFKPRKNAIPSIVAILNKRGPGRHFVKNKVIHAIICERDGTRSSDDSLMFLQDSCCGYVANSTVSNIKRKLEIPYESDHKIHLLAWSNTASSAEAFCWRDELTTLLQSNRRFSRVWLFGRGESSIAFDSGA